MYIEVYSELLNHPKVDHLCSILRITRIYARGAIVSLWLWASKYAEDGDLTKYAAQEIARGIGWRKNPDQLMKALIDSKLLDQSDKKLMIHDWDKHGIRLIRQSRERQRNYRQRERNEDCVQRSASAALNSARATLPKQ